MYKFYKIGDGKPAIAIVGCVHGDEIIGKKVINSLKKIKLKQGSLSMIIANPKALLQNKRFLEADLNRVFPGCKSGCLEERIAFKLKKDLAGFDVVIDVHATNANLDSLAVVTKFNKKIKQILSYLPTKKVALVRKSILGGKELISHVKVGISLDYGPNKTGLNYTKALGDIMILLRNINMISGKKRIYKNKELYKVFGVYKTATRFKQKRTLRDFYFIKKGQIVGEVEGEEVKAKRGFYPIFLGKGRYERTLSWMANKEVISIDCL